jgi:hypothetical protein
MPAWKSLIEEVLKENMKQGNKDSLNVQLSTMPAPDAPLHPSVRTVVFRGFVGQPRKDDEPTGGNPVKEVESALIVTSTDRLMLKAKQLLAQQSQDQAQNGFEVCWWHQGSQEQIRFNGKAWLLQAQEHDNSTFPGDRLKQQVSIPQGDASDWTWESERLRQFAKHSPGLRASFQNPEPGSPITPEKKAKIEKCMELPGSLDECKSDEEKQAVEEALKRFCLVILEVEQVDYLKVEPPAERKQWTLEGDKWQEQEISP